MQLLRLLSLSLPLLALPAARAQFADDYFNRGAQFYISNNLAQARQTVTNGLSLYPDDLKLKKLEELLNQQSQSQSSQQQSQDTQQSQQEQKQQQEQKEQQKEQQKEEQKEEQKERQAQKSSADEDQQPPSNPQSASAGQMTPQEARQLLDSQKNDEPLLPDDRKQKASAQRRPGRDW